MVAVAKALADSARETRVLAIRGGILAGREISAGDVEELSTLPPLDVLRGQVIGAVIAPLTQLLALVAAPLQNLHGLIEARMEQLGGAEAAPEPEPAPAGEEPAARAEAEEPAAEAGSEAPAAAEPETPETTDTQEAENDGGS
jgi:large subunit ribosomal protein L10